MINSASVNIPKATRTTVRLAKDEAKSAVEDLCISQTGLGNR